VREVLARLTVLALNNFYPWRFRREMVKTAVRILAGLAGANQYATTRPSLAFLCTMARPIANCFPSTRSRTARGEVTCKQGRMVIGDHEAALPFAALTWRIDQCGHLSATILCINLRRADLTTAFSDVESGTGACRCHRCKRGSSTPMIGSVLTW